MNFNTYLLFFVVPLLCLHINLIWGFCQEESKEKSYVVQNKLSYPYKSFMYNGSIEDCECGEKVCIRKCCEEDYVFENKKCVFNKTKSFDVFDKRTLINDEFLQISPILGTPRCPNGYYRLQPDVLPKDQFYLQRDGRLWITQGNIYLELDTFCLETTDGSIWAMVCFPFITQAWKHINSAGMIISMPFLIATFVVYAILPEKNVHRRSLMCYVFSLLLAYILLCLINYNYMITGICISTGLACLYFFTTSFFWMNVMSVDMWWTFRGSKDFSGNTKASARKQFLLYSLYAWGVPFILVLIVGLLNTFADPSSWYYPNIGTGVCLIKGSIPELMYLHGPLGLIIVFNLVLFTITAVNIRRVQKDSEILRSSQFKKHNEEEQQRFKLYVRLSLAMGVNWIMEILSWAVNWQVGSVPKAVWYLTDLCNSLYGVIIFIIFVCNKKIWLTLKDHALMRIDPKVNKTVSDVTLSNLGNVVRGKAR